jgi:NADH:ubiquinone reductase (non-electrogenic)
MPPRPATSTTTTETAPITTGASSEWRQRRPWPPQRSWAEVAASKVFATAEDAALIFRRFNKKGGGATPPEQPQQQSAMDSFSESGLVAIAGVPLDSVDAGDASAAAAAAAALTDPPPVRLAPANPTGVKKPLVVVLGCGWASHAAVKVLDLDRYDAVVISPTTAFFFTPLLPQTAVGTLEFRSLCEPTRVANEFSGFLQAAAESLDTSNKTITVRAALPDENGVRKRFVVPYDTLVIAVGEQAATFGVPGVQEHAFFLKELADARRLRKRIAELFETAALPGTSEKERRRLLSFVVVGGGPTGVEFCGTLSDTLREDFKRAYPGLMPYVSVTLLQSAQSVLTAFAAALQERALNALKTSGIEARLGVRVVEVTKNEVVLKTGERLPAGLCVWSTGNAARPFVRELVEQIPLQSELNAKSSAAGRKLAVDPYLRVVGLEDVVALGDCASTLLSGGPFLPATAQVAGQQGAYVGRMLSRGFTFGKGGLEQPPPIRAASESARREALKPPPPLDLEKLAARPGGLTELDVEAAVYGDPYLNLAPPPGAEYATRDTVAFLSLGLLASLGGSNLPTALVQAEAGPLSVQLSGFIAWLLYASVYLVKQVSLRNRVLILFDYFKTKVFGRDLSQF